MLKKKTVSLILIVLLVSAEPCSVYAETRQECLDRCANDYNIRIQSAATQRDIDRASCDTARAIAMKAAGDQFAVCMASVTAGYIIWVVACGTTGPGVPLCVAAATAAYFSAQAACAGYLLTLQNQANDGRDACYATADQSEQLKLYASRASKVALAPS
jgi:hypothetical protein